MNAFIAPLLSFLLIYKYWTLFGAIFTAAFILPLPTNSLLLAAGAFASQGYFSFWISLVVAVTANTLGDALGYFVAKKYGMAALKILHIKTPRYFERLEKHIVNHTGIVIFLSRFFGTTNSVVNLLAGFIGIPYWLFLMYDIIGNTVSTGSVLYIGYLFGINWQDFTGLFSSADWIILAFIVVIAILFALWYQKKRKKRRSFH